MLSQDVECVCEGPAPALPLLSPPSPRTKSLRLAQLSPKRNKPSDNQNRQIFLIHSQSTKLQVPGEGSWADTG